jgi:hypothetical protein
LNTLARSRRIAEEQDRLKLIPAELTPGVHDKKLQKAKKRAFFVAKYMVLNILFLVNKIIDPKSLLDQAAQIPHLERGKLSILRETPNGPLYNHQTRKDGKNVSRYVPRDQAPAVQEAIDGYAAFQNLVGQYVDQMVEKTRAEIAEGSKKKKSPDRSSSLKTPKSSS